jgi:hypothetical protein
MKLFQVFFLLTAASCFAASIQFTGPSTGSNNGSSYVGPYNLLINGLPTEGMCVTYSIEISSGESWTANIDTLSSFSLPDQKLYLEEFYLDTQFNISTDWVGIQQAAWDIFNPGTFTDPDTNYWLTKAQINYVTVNPNLFLVVVPIPTDAAQTFIIPSPEPISLFLFGSGLIFIGCIRKHKKL